MNVKLIAHTQISEDFIYDLEQGNVTDGQMIALTAIRTCYSHNNPSEIVKLEGKKYFGTKAKEGEGTDADRLIRHIINSGHTSTMEHINFTFAIEGVSRSLLAQLTRHRHFSYSVQSQRYVKFGSGDKAEGFDYVVPKTITTSDEKLSYYDGLMNSIQVIYDKLRELGVPAEDARYILPNAATCNLVLTGNLRSFLEFYSKRAAKQAQWEIRELAVKFKEAITVVEPWTELFFKGGE